MAGNRPVLTMGNRLDRVFAIERFPGLLDTEVTLSYLRTAVERFTTGRNVFAVEVCKSVLYINGLQHADG